MVNDHGHSHRPPRPDAGRPRGHVRYFAHAVFVVEPDAMWIIDPSGPDRVTLFACHPKDSEAQRIVGVGDVSVDEPPAAPAAPPESESTPTPFVSGSHSVTISFAAANP